MDDMICLPRSVVAALVDPEEALYINTEYWECSYCESDCAFTYEPTRDRTNHTTDCPVRLAQEALTTADAPVPVAHP